MKSRIILISLILLILFTCSSHVFAEDIVDNSTLTTLNDEIETIPLEDNNVTSEIIITDDNYDNYFNKYTGKFKQPLDENIKTMKIGNVSEKIFTIDKPLNIMPVSSDCQIKNGVIHLIEGSDKSNITNLIINNTKGEIYIDGLFITKLHGIWLSSSNDNLIFNNTIRIPGEEGCYAMPMGYSNRNKIFYNDIVSTFTSCIIMGSCDYNNISFNRIEITSFRNMVTSNMIYMNPFGHADYHNVADCIGTYISNNYFKGFSHSEWSIIINVMGKSDNTVIINNTIFKGSEGISVIDRWTYGRQAINITIKNNTIINSSVSILTSDNDVMISDNRITGSSMNKGIETDHDPKNGDKSNITICNNYIDYENLDEGIDVRSKNSIIKNNIIKISNYGNGIVVYSENSIVTDNIIKVCADNGIEIFNSSNSILNNHISTFGKGISLISEKQPGESPERIIKYYNNSIIGNTILSDNYAVYIMGYVYNTIVDNNVIETNQSEAFYINIEKTFDDKNSGNFTDNTINGVIENTETLIIDDSNFYDYFDEQGYLKYSFKPNTKKILFFTYLTNKDIYLTDNIILTSNKMPNLLYNVSITFKGDASESVITDFNFYNFDKSSIILDGVEDVIIKNNDFTTVTSNVFEANTISIIRGCVGCSITENNIFMNSKANYTYGIYISEPSHSILKKLSRKFTISKNNILIKSSGVGEAMYFDALVESDILNNSMNLITEGSAYGISACNVFESLYDLNIASNEIFVNSKDMSYLIEIYRCHDCQIVNNFVSGFSNGVYGIGIYNSQDISINENEIEVCGLNLTDSYPADALGKGNSAIYITRQSQINDISDNIFDCENTNIITNLNSIINVGKNNFVISNYNYDLYFDSENMLLNNTIKENDTILFKNFTDLKIMNVNVPIKISSYNHLNDFKAVLILSRDANGSIISNLSFIDANIVLNNISDILIINNSFISSSININGFKNNISNNTFLNLSTVNLIDSSDIVFMFNNVSVSSKFINIVNSNYTLISNNIFNSNNTVINSKNALNNFILANKFNINACFGYYANNTQGDSLLDNYISINFENPTAIYYTGNSSKNIIKYNKVISYSKEGFDYAVVVDGDSNRGNVIVSNFLIAANGYKKGDNAVNAHYDMVCNNTPVIIYVSVNGSENGNGSFENPYPSISKAVENSLSGAILHILPGMYNESNIVIDKNITLTAENIEGNTYINALNNQLFNIKKTGILTVNALKIFNGFSVEGGSLFNNLGTLIINNSIIYNSSSYYDNSNPAFKNIKNEYISFDCSNLGVGGAILNRGELIISLSTLFNNFAHKGGAIADFGKTTIKNSLIVNNSATHGGAIFTDTNEELTINDSIFAGNIALTTLDYCTIKRTENNFGYRYVFSSECGVIPGHGGAIYSDASMTIKNSLFENNFARCGGAIAFHSDVVNRYSASNRLIDYFSYEANPFKSDYNLNIENSVFRNNEAKDTRFGNLSLLKTGKYEPTYAQNCHGGAIFGSLNEFNVKDSIFEYNNAYDDGGALCVQAQNSIIEGSKFYNNTAGAFGGALDIFGNYNIFNTDISSNYAKKGGAMQYASFAFYGHVQNNLNAFNVTISKNKALEFGGAIAISGNTVITHSNIYENTAPEGSTFSGQYSALTNSKIDVRNNWWGSTNGPDDSVWNQDNSRFRTWLNDEVNWDVISIIPSDNDGRNNGNNDKVKSSNPFDTSSGSSIHTGSTLTIDSKPNDYGNNIGLNFNGNWPNGNNNANNDGFKFDVGENPFYSSGNSKTNFKGNIYNPNSLSQINSSSISNLDSIGMTANAADSSSTAQSSSSNGIGGDSSKAYEITKEIKQFDELDIKSSTIYLLLFIVLCVMFFIGFYRKYNSDE